MEPLFLFRPDHADIRADTKGVPMPTAPLPENPSLEHLRSQAKLVRDLIRSGDDGALSMIDEFHPRHAAASLTEAERVGFKTADAQLIVARMYGFASWFRLRAHLSIISTTSFTPLPETAGLYPADAFIVDACLDYAGHGPRPDERIARAHQMLEEDPALATNSLAVLATVGDHNRLRMILDETPDAVNAPCGPNRWPLLLYATFSRIRTDNPAWSSTETVRLLLDRGADPNAGFLWRGLVPPFTALTGALGGGEQHQPWHPNRLELAELLLDAGADPNDGQGLYNNGIGGQNHDNPAHLQLLVNHGLGTPQDGSWYRQLGDRLRQPAELLYDELEAAAKRNRPTILRYLLSLGLDPTRPIGRSQLPPARIAAAEGHVTILDALAAYGIDTELTPTEQALRHTRSSDVDALDTLLDQHPDLLEHLRRSHSYLCCNATPGNDAMLRRLVDLGFDINDRSTTKTPLHHAAEAGDTDLARLLVEQGADPNLVDTHIGATPWGWANYNRNTGTADYLHSHTHHDDPLPEFTIATPARTTTLTTPHLIEAHLDRLDQQRLPTLVTIRHDRSALTIGLGHAQASVALYLESDNVAWHATTQQSAPPAEDVTWASTSGDKTFNHDAYLTNSESRAIASAFIANPSNKPQCATWRREGSAT